MVGELQDHIKETECFVCYTVISGEIFMCPKDGNTILCKSCIEKIRNSKCPVC